MDETRREALGSFLRARREALDPKKLGISSRPGRRTPGLRREEVAFLADIGVKWYARLEAGNEIHASTTTLLRIAEALQLTPAELEHMLDLAGLPQPTVAAADSMTIPLILESLLRSLRGVAATVGDRILTPLRWNAIGDAMYGHSLYGEPVDRNALVRSLIDPKFIAFLGPEREELVSHAVGMFRLNLFSDSPSPLAGAVYEKLKCDEHFQREWSRRTVARELTSEKITVRNHAVVGKLSMYATDLGTPMRTDLLLRVLSPADEETERKFDRLEEMAAQSFPPGCRKAGSLC